MFDLPTCYTALIWQLVTDVSEQLIASIFEGQAVKSAWLLELETIGCPETSVSKYQSMFRNIPEERSLISRMFDVQKYCLPPPPQEEW
jgi:hypothetical protein